MAIRPSSWQQSAEVRSSWKCSLRARSRRNESLWNAVQGDLGGDGVTSSCASARMALQLLRHAARFVPVGVRPDVDAIEPVRLPNFGFDLCGGQLVLHMLEKIARVGEVGER